MASHKLRELNKYIKALDVLTDATKSFRSCDQLLNSNQDIEVLKLEIQIQTVKYYLLCDEKDVYPTLTYIRTKENPEKSSKSAEVEYPIDAFGSDGSKDLPKFKRKFSNTDLISEKNEEPPVIIPPLRCYKEPKAQSLPSSFDEKKYDFSSLAQRFGHKEPDNPPKLFPNKSKSEPQSPRHRKSSSSRIRRSGSGRHKWDFFTVEAIAKNLRRTKNKEKEENHSKEYDCEHNHKKNTSVKSRSNRGSKRSSK